MSSRLAMWLREASHSDSHDVLIMRCKTAAGKIDDLEQRLREKTKECEALEAKTKEEISWWKNLLNIRSSPMKVINGE